MKTNKLKFNLLLLALAALPMIGSAAEAPEQTTCPVMVGNPIDPSLHVDYEGQRIYFCCKNCVRMFSENPEQYLNNLPQFASEEAAHNYPGEAHNHASDHGEKTGPSRLVSYLGKFHPVAVHLPIALVLAAALAELLYMLTGNFLFRNVAVFNLLMAVLGAVMAVPLGLAAASGASYPLAYGLVPNLHKWLGIATLLVAAIAAALSLWASRKAAEKSAQLPFRLALLVCAILVALTGHFGGLLVYGLNYFTWN